MAAYLRTQAREKLALGLQDEAQQLFGEAAALLVNEGGADTRNPKEIFPYARHVHVAANKIQRVRARAQKLSQRQHL
jgi:hypothetical protein